MVLALDASLSMMAHRRAAEPSRAHEAGGAPAARAVAAAIASGVLAFAGRSYVLSPLTIDDGALELFLDNLDPSVVGQAGSSLARTIRQGADLLTLTNSGADRALVVMSDGEAFEPTSRTSSPRRSARASRESASSRSDSARRRARRFPIKNPDGSTTLKKDENGNTVSRTITRNSSRPRPTPPAARSSTPARRTRPRASSRALATLRTQGARERSAARRKTPRYQLVSLPRAAAAAARHAARSSAAAAASPSRRPRRRRRRRGRLLLLAVSLNGCAPSHRASQQAVAAYHREQLHAGGVAVPRRDHRGRQDARDAVQLRHGARRRATRLRAAAEALERADRQQERRAALSARCSISVSRI